MLYRSRQIKSILDLIRIEGDPAFADPLPDLTAIIGGPGVLSLKFAKELFGFVSGQGSLCQGTTSSRAVKIAKPLGFSP